MGGAPMRRKAITFISAGAGSGKTTRLTDILVEKLLSGEAKPDGIIATTFTVKAAAELKERVRVRLLEENRHDLSVSIAEAQIGTVNSICGGLLKRFAFELGLTMVQKVLDEHAAKEQLSRAFDGAAGMETITALAERLGFNSQRPDAKNWKDHIKAIIDHARYNNVVVERLEEFARANADELLALFPEPMEENLEEQVLSEIASLKKTIEKDLLETPRKNTQRYLEALDTFGHSLRKGSFAWKDWLKTAKAKPRKDLHPVTEILEQLCRRVAGHPQLHKDIREYLSGVFSIAGNALGMYQKQKQGMGFIDFADQEAGLLEGLDNPQVRDYLKDKLDLLLVDEFQDTSPIQLTLFLKLSALARQTYWVGDVKQAIYGFRGGDARLMKAVLEYLPEGNREVLDRSWRSVPSLVNAVNAIFTRVFSSMAAPEEVLLEAQREEHPSQVSCFHWDIGAGNQEQQYGAVAAGVLRLIDEGYEAFGKQEGAWRKARYGDIAILARTNLHVRKIAAVLKKNGIPAETVQPGLLSSPEAVFVTAALRRLANPADTLATAELYSLATSSEPETWLQDRLDYLNAGGDPDTWLEEGDDAHPVLRQIAGLRDETLRLSPSAALRSLVTSTEAARHILAWCRDGDEARTRLMNVQALIELAGEYEEECGTKGISPTLQGLAHWYSKRAEEEDDLFPEPPVNAVRVLTFHKSKGLEWPVVVLLDLEKAADADIDLPVADSKQGIDASDPLRGRHIRFWPAPFGSSNPFAGLEKVMRSKVVSDAMALAADESARLLYVAMTRARDCLVLGTSSKHSSFPWLEQTGADCLVKGDGENVLLPDGTSLRRVRWELDETSLPERRKRERAQLFWYPPEESSPEHLPEQVSPSLEKAELDALVAEMVPYAGELELRGRREPVETGIAVHAVLAFGLTQKPGACDAAAVERILRGYAMPDLCGPEAFAQQLGSFRRKLQERWPDKRLTVETPVEQLLPGGQVLKGQIDLLLDTGNGWVIIDHKITETAPDGLEAKAMEYTGQLFAYRNALEEVTNRPVESCWINFFAAGTLVRLDDRRSS